MNVRDGSISRTDYARLCALIYDKAGINLGPDRQTMLEARINRRLKALSLDSYADYCQYLFGQEGQQDELHDFIDVVTTNKTDFFREPRHFDFLLQKALPEMPNRNWSSRPFLIWSAGCSTGEEPYTMAMLLAEYAQSHPGFQFRVLATDISTAVLSKASLGIFSSDLLSPVPTALRRKYFMHSRNPDSDQVRVVPELRHRIDFRRLNFMDDHYGIQEKADAIFCRNVIIYFDRQTQQKMLLKLANLLVPDGYLFVGHAETLHDMNLPLDPVAPALYRRHHDSADRLA